MKIVVGDAVEDTVFHFSGDLRLEGFVGVEMINTLSHCKLAFTFGIVVSGLAASAYIMLHCMRYLPYCPAEHSLFLHRVRMLLSTWTAVFLSRLCSLSLTIYVL